MLFVVYDRYGDLVDSFYDYDDAQRLAGAIGGYICKRIVCGFFLGR